MRIDAAISLGEIQFISQYPPDPPEETVGLRFNKFTGLENQSFIVFLVVNPEWLRKAWWLDGQEEKEYLYGKLKQTLQAIDEIRIRGDKVLNGGEIQEIRKKQREQEQAELLN